MAAPTAGEPELAVDPAPDDSLESSLRRLRRAAGMTQEELAQVAGISTRTVSDIERGLRSVVHGDTARRLCSALGLTGESRDMFDALARGRQMGEGPAPPASGIPEVPTPLLGRSRELQAITATLAGRAARLLTLTGPGGIGKTRLAAEAARPYVCLSAAVSTSSPWVSSKIPPWSARSWPKRSV